MFINQHKFSCHASLDGTNEYIEADSLASDVSSNTSGSWSLWFRMPDVTNDSENVLLCFGDTNANSNLRLSISTAGEIRIQLVIGGSFKFAYKIAAASITNNTWYHVKIEQNGTAPILSLNNTLITLFLQVGTDIDLWNDAASGLDNFRIGCQNANSAGNTFFFAGDIENVFVSTSSSIGNIYGLGRVDPDYSGVPGIVSWYGMGSLNPQDKIGSNDGTSFNQDGSNIICA